MQRVSIPVAICLDCLGFFSFAFSSLAPKQLHSLSLHLDPVLSLGWHPQHSLTNTCTQTWVSSIKKPMRCLRLHSEGPTYSRCLQCNHRLNPGTSRRLLCMCSRAARFSYSSSCDPKPRTRTWPASQPHCWACSHRSALLPVGIDQGGTGPPCRPGQQALGTCCKPHHQCRQPHGPCRIQRHCTLKNRETRPVQKQLILC